MFDNSFDYLIETFQTDLVPPKIQEIEVFDLKTGIKFSLSARFFIVSQIKLISDIYLKLQVAKND